MKKITDNHAKVEPLNSTFISVFTKEPPTDELRLPRSDLNEEKKHPTPRHINIDSRLAETKF